MIYILLGDGTEELEAIAPCDYLRRAGCEVRFVTVGEKAVTGGNGITVTADCSVEDIDMDALEMIVVPGGLGGVTQIRRSKPAMDAIRKAYEAGKFVAAICAGPTALAQLGITDGKHATCYPDPGLRAQLKKAMICEDAVVQDGRLITSKGPGTAIDFALALVTVMKGADTAKALAQGTQYTH